MKQSIVLLTFILTVSYIYYTLIPDDIIVEPIVPKMETVEVEIINGLATWYNYDLRIKDQKCRKDDCYSMFNATCASRDFKRGTILTVKYKDKEIECRVNDYGPEESTGKDIDLSSYAFKQLAPLSIGVLEVEIIYNPSDL